MKKISVIIPCYNASDTLYRAWESLKAQTLGIGSLECIFVDDASTDESNWETLMRIENEAPESVLILRLEENMRQGGARNAGLQYATAKYLMFLDADDSLEKNACKELYYAAEQYETDLIMFKYRLINTDEPDGTSSLQDETSDDDSLYDLRIGEARRSFLFQTIIDCGCWNKFYRMKLVKETGVRFAEHRFYEEPLFVYPLLLYAGKVLITDSQYYDYYWHSGSTMTSRLGDCLLDHPQVQLELLEDLMNRRDMFELYHDEIEMHVNYSYYVETLIFSSRNRGFLPLQYFREMQETIRSVFPCLLDNPYIKRDNRLMLVSKSVFMNFDSQEQLDQFACKVSQMF